MASPLGFSEAGREFYYNKLIPMISDIGFDVLDPWSITSKQEIENINSMQYGTEKKLSWQRLNKIIGENNVGAIDASDFIIAILDGTDVDSGTAAEIGYGFAKGKRIIGYRGDFRLSSDNEGCRVNLQVEYFIKKSGGEIATSFNELRHLLIELGE